jgi:two-component system sensor histidine kinase BaeS
MRSLRARLFAATLGAVLVAVGVSLALGVVLTRGAVRETIRKDLSRQVDGLARAIRGAPQAGTGLQLSLPAPPPGAGNVLPGIAGRPSPGPPKGPGIGGASGSVQPGPLLFGRAGPAPDTPIFTSLAGISRLLGAGAAASLRQNGAADGTLTRDGSKDLFAARRVGSRVAIVTRPDIALGNDFGRYLGGLLLASGIGVLLAALVAALLSRRVAAPIRRVSAASHVLASGGSPDPVPREGPEEIEELAGSFNDMASQLALAREAERSVLLSVSHELRTPLTSIRGYAEGIQDGTVEPREAAGIVEREAGRLERLVGDLLAVARLRQGVLEVRREAVDLNQIAREAEQRLRPRAQAADVRLELKADGPAAATADHDRALQVVSNLIENAIRVSPGGRAVTLSTAPGAIVVADEGPGIPEQDLARAFERFHLRNRDDAGSPDGAGLGLSIVRELTEAMGGSVRVENGEAGGARFTVRLPA